ncbi:unnamed protein product [Orchesella dallaii]|uniref:C2H2-type domain-containing protein n=1 Tax=Orchesella dallaii TaxID=48710 RepID=A0ABP1RVL5_9HEXA
MDGPYNIPLQLSPLSSTTPHQVDYNCSPLANSENGKTNTTRRRSGRRRKEDVIATAKDCESINEQASKHVNVTKKKEIDSGSGCLSSPILSTPLGKSGRMTTRSKSVKIPPRSHPLISTKGKTVVKIILPPEDYDWIKKEEEDRNDADNDGEFSNLSENEENLVADFFPIVQSTNSTKQEATSSNDSDEEEDPTEEKHRRRQARRAQLSPSQKKEISKRENERRRQKRAMETEAEKEERRRKARERKERRKLVVGNKTEVKRELKKKKAAPQSPTDISSKREKDAERKRRRRAIETEAERSERLRKVREQKEVNRARESEAEKEERRRKQREHQRATRSITFETDEEKREELRRKMREQKRRFNCKLSLEQRRAIYRRGNEQRRLARSQMTAEQKADLKNSRFFAVEAKKASLTEEEWEQEEFQRKMKGYMRSVAYRAKFTREEWAEKQKEIKGRSYGRFATLPIEKKRMRMEKHKAYMKRLAPERRKQYYQKAMRKYTKRLKETDPGKWEQVYSNILKANRDRIARETKEERQKRLLRYKIYQAKRKAKAELEKEGIVSNEEIEGRLAEVVRLVEENDKLKPEKKKKKMKKTKKVDPALKARPRRKARKAKKQEQTEELSKSDGLLEVPQPQVCQISATPTFELEFTGSTVVLDSVETAQIPLLSVDGESIIYVTCLTLSVPPEEPVPMSSLNSSSMSVQVLEGLQVEGLTETQGTEIFGAHLLNPEPTPPFTFSDFSFIEDALPVQLEQEAAIDYHDIQDDVHDFDRMVEAVRAQLDSPTFNSGPSSPITITTFPEELNLQESDAAQEISWSFDLLPGTETVSPIDPPQASEQPVLFMDLNIPDCITETESLKVNEEEPPLPVPAIPVEVVPQVAVNANAAPSASVSPLSDSGEKKNIVSLETEEEERVICEDCGKCLFQQSMKMHKHLFHNPSQVSGAHKCPKCDKEFATAPSLWNHYLNLHEEIVKVHNDSQQQQQDEQQQVEKDSNSTGNGKESDESSPSSTRQTVFICDQCGKEYRRKGDCEAHVKRVHLEERNVCEVCGKEEQTPGKLWRHKIERHPELKTPPPKGMVVCEYCSQPVLRNLSQHVKKAHPEHYQQFAEEHGGVGGKKKIERNRRINCSECGRKVHKDSIRRHMRNVHGRGSKAIPCHHCGKEFKEQYHLNQHIRVMHALDTFDRKVDAMKLIKETKEEGRPPLLFCSLCNYKLYIRKEMGAHLLSAHLDVFNHLKNSGEGDPPPWKCVECTESPSFGSEKLFYTHIQSSHPSKKYYCSQLNCYKLFPRRNSLRTHHRKEHPQAKFRNPLLHENGSYRNARFTCASCKTLFSRKTELKEHVRSLHPDEFWPCPHCQVICYTEKQLKDIHLQRCRKNREAEGASCRATQKKTNTKENKLKRSVNAKTTRKTVALDDDDKLSREVRVLLRRLTKEELLTGVLHK